MTLWLDTALQTGLSLFCAREKRNTPLVGSCHVTIIARVSSSYPRNKECREARIKNSPR